jgi:hypothetical protein
MRGWLRGMAIPFSASDKLRWRSVLEKYETDIADKVFEETFLEPQGSPHFLLLDASQ